MSISWTTFMTKCNYSLTKFYDQMVYDSKYIFENEF